MTLIQHSGFKIFNFSFGMNQALDSLGVLQQILEILIKLIVMQLQRKNSQCLIEM